LEAETAYALFDPDGVGLLWNEHRRLHLRLFMFLAYGQRC